MIIIDKIVTPGHNWVAKKIERSAVVNVVQSDADSDRLVDDSCLMMACFVAVCLEHDESDWVHEKWAWASYWWHQSV